MARKQFPEDESLSSNEVAGVSAMDEGRPRRAVRVQQELEPGGMDPLDARVLDLDPEPESPFLRAPKRVPVRRGPLPKKTVNKLKYVLAVAAVLGAIGAAGGVVYRYGRSSWRFRLDSSDQVQIAGNHHVTSAQVMEVLGGDISRNVFLIPLADRKAQVERIPWVESATVMRLLPNRLAVEIHERTPIAFVRLATGPMVVADRSGVLMEAGAQAYSFPVIVGFADSEPLSKRAASMKIYERLMRELDSEGANYSRDISEVDLGDPEDVKVLVTDPEAQSATLLHLGSANFLERYKLFVAHVQEWRRQFQKLDSVDLRYDRRVVVNGDAPRASLEAAAEMGQTTEAHKPAVLPEPAKSTAKPKARKWAKKAAEHRRGVRAKDENAGLEE